MLKRFATVAALSVGLLLPSLAPAATITNGFTFSVASACGDTSVGTHFHSSTGGDFGNPAGKAEVGSFGGADCEEVRGLSEYDLSGLVASVSAFVTFDVFELGGLFTGDNDFLYDGPIDIVAYLGNNSEDTSDYQAASVGSVGSFNTAALSVGDILSFDITTIFNTAIGNADPSLGIRLAIGGTPNGGAITFDDFRLTSDDQSTNGIIPLPGALPLMLAGLGGFAFLGMRRRNA